MRLRARSIDEEGLHLSGSGSRSFVVPGFCLCGFRAISNQWRGWPDGKVGPFWVQRTLDGALSAPKYVGISAFEVVDFLKIRHFQDLFQLPSQIIP